ncbi:hypothetical protein CTAYLR_006366 [Chrysophaeum taylorii]|uniref:Glutathione S-transferase n=1 Tax=Chrysophaeum taylorii TaxID=2483200 RepID=A0AAD7U7E2_9STRA|nr:hypothetical protein CTAYLR_006366 [Chrysophaeum taylorii]
MVPVYVPPEVWEFKKRIAGVRPTSGARHERELPRGKHELQLYTLGTPNGCKASILLEELHDVIGVEYDGWRVSLVDGDQYGSEFVKMCPSSHIPLLVDRGVDPPIRVFESGAIVVYLVEKFGFYMPKESPVECTNWIFWGHAVGPVFANFGHFFCTTKIRDAIDYFACETKRFLAVLDLHLQDRRYVCGDEYTAADMVIFPMVRGLDVFYGAATFLALDDEYPEIKRWRTSVDTRAAVRRGLRVAGFGLDAIDERHEKKDFILP